MDIDCYITIYMYNVKLFKVQYITIRYLKLVQLVRLKTIQHIKNEGELRLTSFVLHFTWMAPSLKLTMYFC